VLADIGMTDKFTSDQKNELAKRKNQYYIDMISKFSPSNLEPGAIELFEFLKSKGVKIALGSVSKNGPMLLNNMKITGYFDYIVDPAAVKNAKPAPDIFLNAADYFGFEHKLCVGIEDAPAGITAIKSAEMFAVGIGDKELLKKADMIYQALKEVLSRCNHRFLFNIKHNFYFISVRSQISQLTSFYCFDTFKPKPVSEVMFYGYHL
jgi:beta-phosphoglucomutase